MCAVVDAGTSAQTGGHAGTEISPGRGDKWRFKLEPAGFALRGLFAGSKRRLLTKESNRRNPEQWVATVDLRLLLRKERARRTARPLGVYCRRRGITRAAASSGPDSPAAPARSSPTWPPWPSPWPPSPLPLPLVPLPFARLPRASIS